MLAQKTSSAYLSICIFLAFCQLWVSGLRLASRGIPTAPSCSTQADYTSPSPDLQQTLCKLQQALKESFVIGLTSFAFTSASLILPSPQNPAFSAPVAHARFDPTSKSAFDALIEARNELATILKMDPEEEIYKKTEKGLKKLLSKSNVMLSLKIINKPEVKITQYKSAVIHGLAAIDNLEKGDLKDAEEELGAFISIVKEKEAKAEKAAMFLFN